MRSAIIGFLKILLLFTALNSLSGCFVISQGVLGALDGIENKCSIHPVLIAAGRDGGYRCPQPPNFGITKDNANDTPQNNRCVLEFAVEGGYEMFEAALAAGADPKLCDFPTPDTLFLIWLGTNCNDARYLKKFEELGIAPLISPSEMFGNGFMRCPTAIEYAVSRGADPNAPIQYKTLQERPLESAVGSGLPSNYKAVRTLIKLGADPYLPSMQTGEPIYQYAKRIWTGPDVFGNGLKVWPEMRKALLGQ